MIWVNGLAIAGGTESGNLITQFFFITLQKIIEVYSSFSHSYYPNKRDGDNSKINCNLVKFLAKKRAKTLFLSSFTFFDWHECDVSNTKVS
ncbi:Uncharacterised protein [Streptococcus pneumoniae]|nr:Uncharacterised protein [Streptococcus pneumoniae]